MLRLTNHELFTESFNDAGPSPPRSGSSVDSEQRLQPYKDLLPSPKIIVCIHNNTRSHAVYDGSSHRLTTTDNKSKKLNQNKTLQDKTMYPRSTHESVTWCENCAQLTSSMSRPYTAHVHNCVHRLFDSRVLQHTNFETLNDVVYTCAQDTSKRALLRSYHVEAYTHVHTLIT